MEAAVEALHVAATGFDYEGRPVREIPRTLARSVRIAHVWIATRDRIALHQGRIQVEASIKMLEAWTK